jgi:anti-sigma-K factor RskA
MSDSVTADEFDSLAAEYVLGTLDGDERTRANVLLDVDHGFRGKVRLWERRFGELHLMVEAVEPAPQVWERLKGKIGDALTVPGPKLPDLEKLVGDKAAAPANGMPENARGENGKVENGNLENGKGESGTTVEPIPAPFAGLAPTTTLAPREPTVEVKWPGDAEPVSQIERALAQVREQEAARSAGAEALLKAPSEPEGKEAKPADRPAETPGETLPVPVTIAREPPVLAPAPEPWSLVTDPRLPGATQRFVPPAVRTKVDRSAERIASIEASTSLVAAESRRPRATLGGQRRGDGRLEAQSPPWRLVALCMTALAVLLGGLISAWRLAPERLPEPLRPSVVLNLPEFPGIRRPAPPGSEFDE